MGLVGIAAEIPISVMREVDDRGLVGGGLGLPDQFVGVGQPVGDLDLQGAGIAFLAVLAGVGERDAAGAGLAHGCARPEHLVESLEAAVQVAGNAAGRVVRGEGVFLAVERELAVRDAVAEAADAGAKIAGAREPAGEGVVAEGDVGLGALAVGHLEADEDRPVLGDPGGQALRVGQGEDLHFTAIVQFSVNGGFEVRGGQVAHG